MIVRMITLVIMMILIVIVMIVIVMIVVVIMIIVVMIRIPPGGAGWTCWGTCPTGRRADMS